MSSPGSTQHTEFTLAANYCPPVLNPSTALANAHSVHNESNHLRQNKMLKNSFLFASNLLHIHGIAVSHGRRGAENPWPGHREEQDCSFRQQTQVMLDYTVKLRWKKLVITFYFYLFSPQTA